MATDILPDSRLRTVATAKNSQRRVIDAYGAMGWIPIYCANCGKDGGLVPEENMTFVFYLCTPCADKWGAIAGTYMEPDTAFWEKVKQAQLEKYGRELTAPEIVEELKNDDSVLSKLAKDKPK